MSWEGFAEHERQKAMNTIIKAKLVAAALVFVFAFVTAAQAQTESKCDSKDTDCPNAEKKTVNADKDEAKPSGWFVSLSTSWVIAFRPVCFDSHFAFSSRL